MENQKIYSRMNKENTGLLVIDVVNGCVHEKCENPERGIFFSKIREMVPRLEGFIEQYKKTVGGEVIFVKITPWVKEKLAENLNELYADPAVAYYSDDESGFREEFYGVKPGGEDVVITKNSYDAFAGTDLENYLRKKGIKYLAVAGVFTEGCVLATVAVGFSRGFNFVILKDLIETADSEERQRLSKDIKGRLFPYLYGKTINAEEFLSGWKEKGENK